MEEGECDPSLLLPSQVPAAVRACVFACLYVFVAGNTLPCRCVGRGEGPARWLAGVGGASARELGPFAQTGFGWPRVERAQTGAPSVRGGIAITPSRPLHRVALRPLLAAPYPPSSAPSTTTTPPPLTAPVADADGKQMEGVAAANAGIGCWESEAGGRCDSASVFVQRE